MLDLMEPRPTVIIRSLAFTVECPTVIRMLMKEFRIIVNKSIRAAIRDDIRSRYRLSTAVYRQFSAEHDVYKQYIPSAFEVAMGVLKAYRRRVRKGRKTGTPYIKNLFLRAENQSYRLDRATGRLRIPLRRSEAVELNLPLSEWHRSFLSDPTWSLGSLTLTPDRVMITVRKAAPTPYVPEAAIALDTNEGSLDGVVAAGDRATLIRVVYPEVRVVQATHFRRRRRLAKKKAHDQRAMRHLLAREGRRERERVAQRLHVVSKNLVQIAKATKSAIVLEDLTLNGAGSRSRRTNRRLSSWPRREVHRQIEYKAAPEGVPIIKVTPAWTSKTCPACGARRRDRVGKEFVCLLCNWEMDRQINAGLNILKTALASDEALARAVRFQPGALRNDVMSPLYDLLALPVGAREEPSGVELRRSGLHHPTCNRTRP